MIQFQMMIDESPKYRWPWLLLLFFIMGCVLAVLWMLAEVKRTKQIRDLNNPPTPAILTNKS